MQLKAGGEEKKVNEKRNIFSISGKDSDLKNFLLLYSQSFSYVCNDKKIALWNQMKRMGMIWFRKMEFHCSEN